jgi:hypothetical protein
LFSIACLVPGAGGSFPPDSPIQPPAVRPIEPLAIGVGSLSNPTVGVPDLYESCHT